MAQHRYRLFAECVAIDALVRLDVRQISSQLETLGVASMHHPRFVLEASEENDI